MADKISMMENLMDDIDTSESVLRDIAIDWFCTQLTQENCEQINDMLHGFLSEFDYLRSSVGTNLPVLEKQITTSQDALVYNSLHGKYEILMQVMSGLAVYMLNSFSNPETFLSKSHHSYLDELATKFWHHPQWEQLAILNRVKDLLSDNSEPLEIPDPTPIDTQDNPPPSIDIPDQTLATQDNTPTPPTETVNQGIDIPDQTLATQDNAPPPPTDTPIQHMVQTDSELDFELDFDSELDVDIAFEEGDEFDFDMPQDIEPAETPSDPTETNDNIPPLDDNNSPSNTQDSNRPIDFDVDSNIDPDLDFDIDSNIDPDLDFDIDSDSDSDPDFEDIGGMFLAGCEIFRKRIPPRKPVPLFLFE